MNHENIVRMIEITMASPPDKDVFIVFDYLEHDLSGLMKSSVGSVILKEDEDKKGIFIKGVMYQLLQGLRYLHEKVHVIHRDMKGSNILIDKHGRVKLADFGLARLVASSNQDDSLSIINNSNILPVMTNRVITLWFRPPEVLLGSDTYGPEVDIWGLGCIFAELFLEKAAFSGSDEVSQIEAILIGLSSERENPKEALNIFSTLPWYNLLPNCLTRGYRPQDPQSSLRNRLKCTNIGSDALELLFSMLEFDPKRRITCHAALNSAYFRGCDGVEFEKAYCTFFETSECFNSEFKSSDYTTI
jgi:serine/threonine protein kinase